MGRREVWIWGVVLAAVAFWGKIVAAPGIPDPHFAAAIADIANSIIEAGAFTVAAWVMVMMRAGDLVPRGPASPRLILAVLGIGLLCIIPSRPATVLVLVVLGGALLRSRQTTRGGRQAGLLLLALALVAASESKLLGPVHMWVAGLDAHLVAWTSRLAGISAVTDGNVVMHGTSGIEIWIACTSSVQLPQVVLAFCVVVLHRRGEFRPGDLPWLLSALLVSVALTEIRLSQMIRSDADYTWWHSGPGLMIYSLAALTLALLFPLLATIRTADMPVEQRA
jgi:hypothetical protein